MKKFVKNIGLYCIVFEKEISQKNCIVLYCFLKKNSQKIALYCIVFEKQISILARYSEYYCFQTKMKFLAYL